LLIVTFVGKVHRRIEVPVILLIIAARDYQVLCRSFGILDKHILALRC